MRTLSLLPEYAGLEVTHRKDDVWSGETQMFERWYQIGTMPSMPSVTTVLDMIGKPGLRDWKMNKAWEHAYNVAIADPWPQCPESEVKRPKTSWRARLDALKRESKAAGPTIMDVARKIGDDVHGTIAACLQGESYEMQHGEDIGEKGMEQYLQALHSYNAWREESNVTPLWTERTIWSSEHQYAGSPDLVGAEEDRVVLLDWKTGAGIYPEHGAQVAAYANAVEELTGVKVDECRIVHLYKNELGFKEHTVEDWRETFKVFKASLRLFNAWHDGIFTTHDSGASAR